MHKDGRTVVLITHDKDIANFAKRRIYLRDGKIERDESSAEAVLR
jgi:ABC-type lipoprotein export system ATPase subunit